MFFNFIIVCLLAGEIAVVDDYSCEKYPKAQCWEIGQNPISVTFAILCGSTTPGGVFIPEPCPSQKPKPHVVRLSCKPTPPQQER